MKCLRCDGVDLKAEHRGDGADVFEIDICSGCSGIWLDADELARLDDNLFVDIETIDYVPAAADTSDRLLSCPRCDVAMNKVHPAGFPAVVVDNCPTCRGFWLDAGELDKMRDVSDRMLIRSLLD